MTFTQVVLTGAWPTSDGSVRSGDLLLSLTGRMEDSSGHIIVPEQLSARLDDSGAAAVQVFANDDTATEPSDRQYYVQERIVGATPRSYYVTVPAAPAGSRAVTDAVTGAGSTVLTSATAAFGSGDVGKYVTGPGIPPLTKIASRTNGTTVVLSNAATVAASGVHVTIGAQLDLSTVSA